LGAGQASLSGNKRRLFVLILGAPEGDVGEQLQRVGHGEAEGCRGFVMQASKFEFILSPPSPPAERVGFLNASMLLVETTRASL
jgi:hypothetical protein